MAAHDLHHERTLVRSCGAGQRIDRFDDAVKGRVSSDRHVRSDHVIVDRSDHARDDQVGVPQSKVRCDLIGLDELREQSGPLGSKQVSPGERAVSAHNDEAVDSVQNEVARRLEAAVTGTEFG